MIRALRSELLFRIFFLDPKDAHAHVHEHVHDNVKVNVDVYVDLDVLVDVGGPYS